MVTSGLVGAIPACLSKLSIMSSQSSNQKGSLSMPTAASQGLARCTAGDLNVPELNRHAVKSLTQMFNAEHELFCYKMRQDHTGLVREGLSRRYTLMTILGLHRSEAAGISSPVDIQNVLGGLLRDVTWIDNTGDLGLLLWAAAIMSPERLTDQLPQNKLRTVLTHCRDLNEGRTMETAWFLSGLAHAASAVPKEFQQCEDLARQNYELLQKTQGSYGFFGHLLRNGTLSGNFRGRIGSFADQVYPIYALSRFAQAYGVTEAFAMSKNCADAICRVQGPRGQWWWHYDALTGRVVEKYPVYSVHQEGMAPMALFELQESCALNYEDAIYRGLSGSQATTNLHRICGTLPVSCG